MRPLRLVLDTNVWLDWLVFEDITVDPIRHAAKEGAVQIFIDAPCELELRQVLGRQLGKLSLTPRQQLSRMTDCRLHAVQHTHPGLPTMALPACRDPDDQKFLQLALSCGADVLVSRDHALLDMDKRKKQPLPFRVMRAEEFRAKVQNRR